MPTSLRAVPTRSPTTSREGEPGERVVRVVPWTDRVVDALGYDPRSWYVETFWLSVLGPTGTWLVRRLVAGLDTESEGFDLDVEETARALGVGRRDGRNSPFRRALGRCVSFGLVRNHGPPALAVRRRIPPLP